MLNPQSESEKAKMSYKYGMGELGVGGGVGGWGVTQQISNLNITHFNLIQIKINYRKFNKCSSQGPDRTCGMSGRTTERKERERET